MQETKSALRAGVVVGLCVLTFTYVALIRWTTLEGSVRMRARMIQSQARERVTPALGGEVDPGVDLSEHPTPAFVAALDAALAAGEETWAAERRGAESAASDAERIPLGPPPRRRPPPALRSATRSAPVEDDELWLAIAESESALLRLISGFTAEQQGFAERIAPLRSFFGDERVRGERGVSALQSLRSLESVLTAWEQRFEEVSCQHDPSWRGGDGPAGRCARVRA